MTNYSSATICLITRSKLFPILNTIALLSSIVIFILSCSFPWYSNTNYISSIATFEFMIFNAQYGIHLFLYILSYISLFLFVLYQIICNLIIGFDNTILFARINALFFFSQCFQIAFFLFSNFQLWIGSFVSITLCTLCIGLIYFFSIHVHYGTMGRFYKRYKTETPLPTSLVPQKEVCHEKYRTMSILEYWIFQPCFSIYLTWLFIQMINTLLIILFDQSQGNIQVAYLGLNMDWIGCLAQTLVCSVVVLFLVLKVDWIAPMVVIVYWIGLLIKLDLYMAFTVTLWIHLFYMLLGTSVAVIYLLSQWMCFKRPQYLKQLLMQEEEKKPVKKIALGQITSSSSGDLTIHTDAVKAATAMSCA